MTEKGHAIDITPYSGGDITEAIKKNIEKHHASKIPDCDLIMGLTFKRSCGDLAFSIEIANKEIFQLFRVQVGQPDSWRLIGIRFYLEKYGWIAERQDTKWQTAYSYRIAAVSDKDEVSDKELGGDIVAPFVSMIKTAEEAKEWESKYGAGTTIFGKPTLGQTSLYMHDPCHDKTKTLTAAQKAQSIAAFRERTHKELLANQEETK